MMRPIERMRHRQASEDRKRVLIIIVISMLLLFALGLGVGFAASATESSSYLLEEKYYAQIEIAPGDTILSLADDYMDNHWRDKKEYTAEVCRLNHIENADRIVSGQHILLPYYL